MAHPIDHAKSAAKRWGGTWEDYIAIEEWFDATKAWIGHSKHRMFRHHSEGIFECEKVFGKYIINSVFGKYIINSDGKKVYTRYIGERHVKEDCFNYIPSAKEWVQHVNSSKPPEWMIRTLNIETD
jgi:hypothetical protein